MASRPGFLQRVKAAVGYTVTGDSAWFGPLSPSPPLAPASEKGRQLDYQFGYNLLSQPRQQEPLRFYDLQTFSYVCTLLRLVIETRKDQMSVLQWAIRPRDEELKPNRKCKNLTAFLQSPDQEHDWAAWIRMLLEDLFVIDAPTLYVRPTLGGEVYGFDVIDGSTIARKVDHFGRTPAPPETAYQQMLHGLPATDYTTDELIYLPRNQRPGSIYGYSPVEQVVATINTAVRRDAWLLSYFTEGSIPEMLLGVPRDPMWGPDQIAQLENHLNIELEGSVKRRKINVIPAGTTLHQMKDPQHFSEIDEWLARIICYCFSIPPTPFVRQMNRATAATATEQSIKEGQEPTKHWIKQLHDLMLRKHLNAPELEFVFEEEDDIDPLTQAQIYDLYVKNGTLSTDAVRRKIGAEPEDAPAPEPKPESGLTPEDTDAHRETA